MPPRRRSHLGRWKPGNPEPESGIRWDWEEGDRAAARWFGTAPEERPGTPESEAPRLQVPPSRGGAGRAAAARKGDRRFGGAHQVSALPFCQVGPALRLRHNAAVTVKQKNCGIVGMGRLGSALALRLAEAGFRVVAVSSRRTERLGALVRRLGCRLERDPAAVSRAAGVLLLTVPDDVLAELVASLAQEGAFRQGQCVLHCSGAHPAEVLAPARRAGAAVGLLHPLQTFADMQSAVEGLRGCWFAVQGDPPAREMGVAIAGALGGFPFELPAGRERIYHAAAVLASNYLVALQAAALELLELAGLSSEQGRSALGSLVRTTVENLLARGPEAALTGPIVRGDIETVRRHLEALEEEAPDLLRLYGVLGERAVALARRRRGTSPEKLEAIQALLRKAQTPGAGAPDLRDRRRDPKT